MNTKHTVRLHLFFASENDRAVILRQGPSKHYRMILWHRGTDRFEDGQWITHKVYTERCNLSPDGAHFLYFCLDGKLDSPGRGSYTAISKPPYWTALSLFPLGDTWAGGGVFLDNTHVFADGGSDVIGRADSLNRVFLGEPAKGCSTGLRLKSGARAPLDRAATKRLLAEPRPSNIHDLRDRMAVPHDPANDKYLSEEGKLYRYQDDVLTLIRDFTDMEFEPIKAPYDWRENPTVDGKQAWHPLDGDSA